MSESVEDVVEVTCPKCGAKASVDKAKAERDFKATCPKGHEIPLAKMI